MYIFIVILKSSKLIHKLPSIIVCVSCAVKKKRLKKEEIKKVMYIHVHENPYPLKKLKQHTLVLRKRKNSVGA